MKYRPPPCEICSANDWQSLGKRGYSPADAATVDDSTRKRFRVLFEKWFPGSPAVELECVCCRHCGFVMYLPRPEEADIDNKYRFLAELGQDPGQAPFFSPGEQRRSRVIWEYLGKRIALADVRDVLDYGGGDGRLMQAFRENGISCFLVDYCRNCLPGVAKLADTIYQLPPERTFDLVVCSHVIEHVAEPLKVVAALSRHLRANGHLFVEVPMEIWKKTPLQREPVTHINFFTPNSLWNLLCLAGLRPLQSELTGYRHPNGKRVPVVRALAAKAEARPGGSRPVLKNGDLDAFLHPGLSSKLRYYSANPSSLLRAARRALRTGEKALAPFRKFAMAPFRGNRAR